MKQVRAGTRRSSLTFSPSRASGEPSVSVTVRSLTRPPGAESARLMKTRDDKIRPSSMLIVPKGRLSGCERSSSRRQHPATRRQQRRLKGTLIFNLKTLRAPVRAPSYFLSALSRKRALKRQLIVAGSDYPTQPKAFLTNGTSNGKR